LFCTCGIGNNGEGQACGQHENPWGVCLHKCTKAAAPLDHRADRESRSMLVGRRHYSAKQSEWLIPVNTSWRQLLLTPDTVRNFIG
jgi:hypothetical protein